MYFSKLPGCIPQLSSLRVYRQLLATMPQRKHDTVVFLCSQTELISELPLGRVERQRPGTVQVLPDQHLAVLPVQLGHLDPVGASVSPVQVLAQPVHGHALGVIQAKLHHVLQRAAVHERSADGLQGCKDTQANWKTYQPVTGLLAFFVGF